MNTHRIKESEPLALPGRAPGQASGSAGDSPGHGGIASEASRPPHSNRLGASEDQQHGLPHGPPHRKDGFLKGHLGRVITAVVLLPILYFVVRYGPSYIFFLLVAGGILISQYELYRFYYSQNHTPKILLGLILGFFLALSFYLKLIYPAPNLPVLFLTLITICAMLFSLFTVRELKTALSDTAVMLFGVVYVSFLLSHLLPLRGLPEGQWLILFVLGITWLCDAGAYYIGSLLGRHPLASLISPKKTVEGAVGGLAVSILGSLGAKFWFLPALSVADSVFVGLLLGVVGQMGDLVESLWKRSAGVKDSSTLLMAQGGLLDKVDSLIFTAPVFYYYLILVKGY